MASALTSLLTKTTRRIKNFDDFVAIALTAKGDGYWLVRMNGEVFEFNAPALPKVDKIGTVCGIARGPSNHGYWLLTTEGEVRAVGDAVFKGDLKNPSSKKPEK